MGSDSTFFRFLLPPFHSIYWLWELVRERPCRRRILGLDEKGPCRIQAIGNGLMVIGSWPLLRERPFSSLLHSRLPRGREDGHLGRMVSAGSQERTLSHQTEPNRSRQRTRDDATTRAASELGSRHLDTAGSEISGSFTLMWKGR